MCFFHIEIYAITKKPAQIDKQKDFTERENEHFHFLLLRNVKNDCSEKKIKRQ